MATATLERPDFDETDEDLENVEEAICESCSVLHDTDFMTWEKFEDGSEGWVCDHCTGKSEPDPH